MELWEGRLYTDAQFPSLHHSNTPLLHSPSSSSPPDFAVRAEARFCHLSRPKQALKPPEQFKIEGSRKATRHAHHEELPQSAPAQQRPLRGRKQKKQCQERHDNARGKSQKKAR